MNQDNFIDDNLGHDVSLVMCTRCGYWWVAVRPEGTLKLECPNCRGMVKIEEHDQKGVGEP